MSHAGLKFTIFKFQIQNSKVSGPPAPQNSSFEKKILATHTENYDCNFKNHNKIKITIVVVVVIEIGDH